MSLKILCAGCSSEERAAVEAGVRAGLGDRPRRDPWTVSLVKFGNGYIFFVFVSPFFFCTKFCSSFLASLISKASIRILALSTL